MILSMNQSLFKISNPTIHHQELFFLEALYQTLHLLLTAFKEDTLFFIKGAQAWAGGHGGHYYLLEHFIVISIFERTLDPHP